MHILVALFVAILPLCAVAQDEQHVEVSLLCEHTALVPGTPAQFGIRFEHEPHWHTYWVNPGDSGLATRLSWQVPSGFRAGEVAWPAPQRIGVGDLQNFGYEGDVLLPVAIEIPADTAPGTNAQVAVEVKYLVCREQCIPGKANLALDIPVRVTAGASDAAKRIQAARTATPTPANWNGEARLRDDSVVVTLRGQDLPAVADAFVAQRKLVNYAAPQIARTKDSLTLTFAKSDYFVSAPPQIDLVLRSGAQTWSVSLPFSSSSQ